VGAGIGVLIPQPFSDLSAGPLSAIDAGVLPPGLGDRLALSVSLAYAQPLVTRTISDARVPGGSYTSTLVVRGLRLGIGAQFHILPRDAALTAYAGLRAKAFFLREEVEASAGGQPFGLNEERGVRAGAAPYGGVWYRIGPGSILGEIELDLATTNHETTGVSSLSALVIRTGYVFTF
jgi:hypothetical protein